LKKKLSNEVLKKVMNELYYYLMKQGADSETAKDIVQDSVYKMMVHIEAVDPDKYRAWLFKVATNLYYDYCRKKNRAPSLMLDETLASNAELIEDALITKENQQYIRKMLDLMPTAYKQLLLLKYELEWSYQQIADYLEIKPNNVKTYLARARKKFKEIYQEENNEKK